MGESQFNHHCLYTENGALFLFCVTVTVGMIVDVF